MPLLGKTPSGGPHRPGLESLEIELGAERLALAHNLDTIQRQTELSKANEAARTAAAAADLNMMHEFGRLVLPYVNDTFRTVEKDDKFDLFFYMTGNVNTIHKHTHHHQTGSVFNPRSLQDANAIRALSVWRPHPRVTPTAKGRSKPDIPFFIVGDRQNPESKRKQEVLLLSAGRGNTNSWSTQRPGVSDGYRPQLYTAAIDHKAWSVLQAAQKARKMQFAGKAPATDPELAALAQAANGGVWPPTPRSKDTQKFDGKITKQVVGADLVDDALTEFGMKQYLADISIWFSKTDVLKRIVDARAKI